MYNKIEEGQLRDDKTGIQTLFPIKEFEKFSKVKK